MLETFNPHYSANSRHKLAAVAGTVEWMTTLKAEMQACGWNVSQTFVGRGVVLAGGLPTAPPLQPGEVPTLSQAQFKAPYGNVRVGETGAMQYYDPLRQLPGQAGVF